MKKLEKLIPLPQAAARLGLTVEALTRLVDSGTIKANVHEGVVLIPEREIAQTITREQFAKLRGKPITVAQAIEKYGLNSGTWSRYIRTGLIEVLTPGYRMTLNEADVAYCAKVYEVLGGKQGSRIFDDQGRPYQLVRPEVAEYRRKHLTQKAQRVRA